jgi:hypothetical protein
MPEEQADVTPESFSALGEAISATPEVQQEAQEAEGTETGTPQQPDNQEQNVPFNEHPRFKELIEEKNWYRQQLERASLNQPQPQQPTTDPYASMTPEEERFWRAVDQRAERIAEAKIQRVNPMLESGLRELTNMKVQQFRDAHKDIKPNSPEELAIAQRIQQGYIPEDAYRAVMWDRRSADAEKQANSNIKQKIEAKKQANVEQKSIPQGAGAPTKSKLTLRQRIEQTAKELGEF